MNYLSSLLWPSTSSLRIVDQSVSLFPPYCRPFDLSVGRTVGVPVFLLHIVGRTVGPPVSLLRKLSAGLPAFHVLSNSRSPSLFRIVGRWVTLPLRLVGRLDSLSPSLPLPPSLLRIVGRSLYLRSPYCRSVGHST